MPPARRRTTAVALAALSLASMGAAAAVVAVPAGAATGPSHTTISIPSAPKDPSLPSDPTLAQVQAAAATAIANRQGVLGTLLAQVQAATDLGSDQAPLVSELQGTAAGLTQLGTTIAADTTVAAALGDDQKIFADYRVYALVLPVTRLVAADDHLSAVGAPALTAEAATLAAKETPADQAQVQPLLADLATKVQAATGAVSGQSATLLAFTPSAYDADHALLDPAKATTATAQGAMKAARADALQAAHDLGLKVPGSTGAPTTGTPTTTVG